MRRPIETKLDRELKQSQIDLNSAQKVLAEEQTEAVKRSHKLRYDGRVFVAALTGAFALIAGVVNRYGADVVKFIKGVFS